MDSPGHCAQYCTYTVMENDSREIISVVTVDKRQTGRNSVIMEREAFVQTVDILMKEVKLVEVCTDAHVQISALMSKLPLFWTDGGWGGGITVVIVHIIFSQIRQRKVQRPWAEAQLGYVAWGQEFVKKDPCCKFSCNFYGLIFCMAIYPNLSYVIMKTVMYIPGFTGQGSVQFELLAERCCKPLLVVLQNSRFLPRVSCKLLWFEK